MEVENELVHLNTQIRFDTVNNMEEEPSTNDSKLPVAEEVDGVIWNFDAKKKPPPNIPIHVPTHIKEGCQKLFRTPLISLLQFIPIGMWLIMVKESNKYAHQVMDSQSQLSTQATISGRPWNSDITINELMTFFGVMIHMCIRPMPGRTYTEAWKYPDWQPYTKNMTCGRFRQIRSVLHVSDNNDSKSQEDSLWKVRHLFNTFKLSASKFVNVGRNLALDECSIASRSKYGRMFIFYNATKPTGKYHFRFYMLCCSTTHIMLSFKMHTQDNSDYTQVPIGVGPRHEAEGTLNQQKISKLVLEMVSAYNNSLRIINMDRYYGSCITVMNLRRIGLFARCTTKENVKHFPKAITYKKSEITLHGRGSYRMASEEKYGMVVFSWCDGNAVNIISTADGSSIGVVTRQIGKKQFQIQSPISVQQYNKNMDAVDRWDQLLGKFSLHRRHKFKKYYRNIMMVILDFAILQDQKHYNLANYKDYSDGSRVKWYETLAEEMIHTDWNKFVNFAQKRSDALRDIGVGTAQGSSDITMHNIGAFMTQTPTPEEVGDGCCPIAARDIYTSVAGQCCQICKFEGRGRKMANVNYCGKHMVRCCSSTHVDHTEKDLFRKGGTDIACTEWSWLCPYQNLTCWDKYHKFYHQQNIFIQQHSKQNKHGFAILNRKNQLVMKRNKALKPASPTSFTTLNEVVQSTNNGPGNDMIIRGRTTPVELIQNDLRKDNYDSIMTSVSNKTAQKSNDIPKTGEDISPHMLLE